MSHGSDRMLQNPFFWVFRKKGHHHPKYYHGSTLKIRFSEKKGYPPPNSLLGSYSAGEISRKSIYHPLKLSKSDLNQEKQ